MSVKIYDSTIGAFKDAETPLIWDEQAQAWKDSVGLVWNESAQAWEERWIASRLPNLYQEVEYIKSDGKQYIDTGVAANQNTGFMFDYKKTNSVYRFWGTARTGWVRGFCYNGSDTEGDLFVTYGNNGHHHEIMSEKSNERVKVSYINHLGTNADGTTWNLTIPDFNSTGTIVLFALRYNGNIEFNDSNSFCCYEFALYQGTDMVRDFIPCYRKSDQVAGMFDLVTGEFYVNKGSGTFSVGSNV